MELIQLKLKKKNVLEIFPGRESEVENFIDQNKFKINNELHLTRIFSKFSN